MTRLVSWTITLAILSSGCEAPDAQGTDVLADTTRAVYATTQCTLKNPDGEKCDRKTCREDQSSDCLEFATRCIDSGHNYNGSKQNGVCTRQ